MGTAIILYEPEHLASLDTLLARFSGARIVSLDAEIDYALEKRGIPFISGKTLQNRETPVAYLRADKLTQDMCESEALSFLTYKNVSLLEPLRFSVHLYFIRLLTYIDLIARAVEQMGVIERLVVLPPTSVVFSTSGFLAEHEAFAVVEAARRVAQSRDIAFEAIQSNPVALRMGNRLRNMLFMGQRALFAAAISFFNALMSLHPRRSVCIIASDYWRNIAPVLKGMPEAEVIMIDRKEALKAGWRNIWRHTMRFMHLTQFLSWTERREALRHARECERKWLAVKSRAWTSADFMFYGVSLAPICERIMTRLVKHAVPRVTRDIAGAYAMYARLSPDAVWLRVSVSGQMHFSVLPLVARNLDIPSLEPQHGIDYSGAGSATRRHAAQYFAVYGPLVAREFEALGYAKERLLAAGSPRFDSYARTSPPAHRRRREKINVLTTIPNVNPFERFGTYSVEEHFSALRGVLAGQPQLKLTVTSRNVNRVAFLHEAMERGLQGTPYEFAGPAPLPRLFADTDIFVCGYSTVVYEALLHSLPTIIIAFAPQERLMTEYSFATFEQAGALVIARTPEELKEALNRLLADAGARERMGATGLKFMRENFSFDGHASERIAALIRSWSKGTTTK